MTLAAPTFPLTPAAALAHLMDALGGNYGGLTDELTLGRALSVDGIVVGGAFHLRPWATAARLIRDNTEYEVGGTLAARIDRKLDGLGLKQTQMDALAGILHLLPGADDGTVWPPMSGSVETRGVF